MASTPTTTELTLRALAALEVAGLAYSTYDTASACAASSIASMMLQTNRNTDNAVVAAGGTPCGMCSPAHVMARHGGDETFAATYTGIRSAMSLATSDAERIVVVHQNAAAAAALAASEAVHAVAMSFYQRMVGHCVDAQVHESVAPWLEALSALADGPGGHGLVLCRIVTSLECVFRWGTVKLVPQLQVLGGCHAPLGKLYACAPPKMPSATVLGAVRWLPIPAVTLDLLSSSADGFGTGGSPFMHIVTRVRGKYLIRLRRMGKLCVSVLGDRDTLIASMTPMDGISDAVSYGKAHMKCVLAEGISMHSHDKWQVRTVVENGVLQRCDVVTGA